MVYDFLKMGVFKMHINNLVENLSVPILTDITNKLCSLFHNYCTM
jgi:hypothetical protein